MNDLHYLALVCSEYGQTVRTIMEFFPEAVFISDSQDLESLGLRACYSSCFVWEGFILALESNIPRLHKRFDILRE